LFTFDTNNDKVMSPKVPKSQTAAKIFWAANLKFLRNRKGLNQEQLSEALQMSRSKYNAQENGQTANPPLDDLLRISDYYRISIDHLLRTNLAGLKEKELETLEAGTDISGRNLRVLAISTDKDEKENMEYVPVKARAGYRAGFNDPEFIAALPKFSLPNLPQTGTFRMFPTTGDSMLPIPEGCDVICSFVQDWGSLKPRTLCIVILKGEQDFVFKQVTLQKEGVLLESLNKLYAPYTVPVSEVLELWKFHSYQSREIPEAESDLQSLTRAVKEMQTTLQALKRS